MSGFFTHSFIVRIVTFTLSELCPMQKLRATVLEAKKDLSDRQEERKAHSRRKEDAVEAEKSSRTVREEIKVDLDFQAQRAAKLETQASHLIKILTTV